MVGVGGAHHALLKISEVTKLHRHIKAPLCHLRPASALQCLIKRPLRSCPDNAFVIEMANDRIEVAMVQWLPQAAAEKSA